MPRKSYKSVLWDHSGSGAGAHRLQAAVDLGWDWIDVVFHDDWSEIDRQLWEIDENLMRAELSPTELGEHITRREELWKKRNSAQTLRTIKGPGMPKGFASDTAEKTGVSKRAVQLATSRAKEIPADVRDQIKGTNLDTGVYLDWIKGMEPDRAPLWGASPLRGAYPRCQPMLSGRVSAAMLIRFGKVSRPMRIGSNRLAMI